MHCATEQQIPRRLAPGDDTLVRARWRLAFAAALIATFVHGADALAQNPGRRWLTLSTVHFRVHFTQELEPLARRAASHAERAYAQLAAALTPPRGPIDLVVADDADLANGFATPIPSNRIVVQATPPIDDAGLRFTTDWLQLVVTHELAHVFHLDRTRGPWRLAQRVFGRAPPLFPNLYSPSWLAEGLAVYYETALAGQGRLESPGHALIARAAAIDHRVPSLGNVSLAGPRFPFGQVAYAYGSLLVDHLARTRGPDRVRSFVEAQSVSPVPYLIDLPARTGFGTSFGRAFREMRDSIERSLATGSSSPIPGWREITGDGGLAALPRWISDSALLYTGTPGRDSYGLYRVGADGDAERIGRRNSRSPNTILRGGPYAGSILFAQIERMNLYEERSDLYVQRVGGRERRLTRGARLTAPDARSDGGIVAIELVVGGSRVVRVSPDAGRITPITSGGADEQWTEPRWSARGDRIAVVRWLRGGVSQVVVIDTLGIVRHVAVSGQVIPATPAWLPGDAGLVFSLGRNGVNEVVTDRFDSPPVAALPVNGLPRYRSSASVVGSGSAGLFDPDPSPDGRSVAAVALRGDGYRVGMAECCVGTPVTLPLELRPDPRTSPAALDTSRADPFSPVSTLLPRYWLPLIEPGYRAGEYRIGGSVFGRDVIGRHAIAGTLLFPTDGTGRTGALAYEYAGFGLPILSAAVAQDWSWFRDIESREAPTAVIGEIGRRIRDASISLTWLRPRLRSSIAVSGGIGVEQRSYRFTPSRLRREVDAAGTFNDARFPRLTVGAAYARYEVPPFAISPENGLSATISARESLTSGFSGVDGASTSAVAVGIGYRALDLPGFAHHVVAVRLAGGWSDARAAGYFEVGGTSGGSVPIVPGYAVGEGRRTFGVRGFAPATLFGSHAATASVEYRAPLILDRMSLGVLPFFAQRSSVALWADHGAAWCPDAGAGRQICGDPLLTERRRITSIGAELNIDAGILSWDAPYRLRFGVALPRSASPGVALPARSFYLTAGTSY